MNTTQLTVAARAAVALGSSKAEAELTALALQSKSITAVTSPDGRAECHAAAMTAKAARVAAEQKPAPITVAEVVEAIAPEIMQRLPLSAATLAEVHPIADNGAMMKTGEICDRLGFIVKPEFLESLGFNPAAIDKAAKLYKVSQFPAICAAIVRHIEAVSVMKEAA